MSPFSNSLYSQRTCSNFVRCPSLTGPRIDAGSMSIAARIRSIGMLPDSCHKATVWRRVLLSRAQFTEKSIEIVGDKVDGEMVFEAVIVHPDDDRRTTLSQIAIVEAQHIAAEHPGERDEAIVQPLFGEKERNRHRRGSQGMPLGKVAHVEEAFDNPPLDKRGVEHISVGDSAVGTTEEFPHTRGRSENS